MPSRMSLSAAGEQQRVLRAVLVGGVASLALALAVMSSARPSASASNAVVLLEGGGGGRGAIWRPVMPPRARQQMLRGLGEGPESDSAQDWEVGMHLDWGCQKQLEARKQGNIAWQQITEREPCIPNKKLNPMMWPFAKPGKAWVVEGKRPEEEEAPKPPAGYDVSKQEYDTYKEMPHYLLAKDSDKALDQWPYNHKDLDNFVETAEKAHPTIDWTDGILHGNPADDDAGEEVDKAAEPPLAPAATK